MQEVGEQAATTRLSSAERGMSHATKALAWPTLLVLHLLPGVLIGAVFVLLARLGAPANLALLLSMLLVALPVELGTLVWLGRRERGKWTVRDLIVYRDPLPRRQAMVLIPLLFLSSLVAFTLLAPLA